MVISLHISHSLVSLHFHLRLQLPLILTSIRYFSIRVLLKRRTIYLLCFIEISIRATVEIFSAYSEGVHLNLKFNLKSLFLSSSK